MIPNDNQNCKVLTLNHIKSDNAIALLKSLDYFIVDFTINDQGQYLPNDNIEGVGVNQDGLKIIPFPYSQTEYLDTGIIGDESEYGLEECHLIGKFNARHYFWRSARKINGML